MTHCCATVTIHAPASFGRVPASSTSPAPRPATLYTSPKIIIIIIIIITKQPHYRLGQALRVPGG
jgi:hypothetical protein